VAVMVDLGWPWWVTTLIAAGVALVAAWAFVRTRRTTVRAVAALILLEAVGIGVVAPFVMEDADDSGGGPTAMSSGDGTEFAEQADANCRRFGEFAATLGNPKTPAGIERQMDRFLPEFWQAIVAQGELEAPSDGRVEARQWMRAMAAVGQDYESLRAAASRRVPKAMERAKERAETHAMESARLSKQLGMRVCFQ
jgi:tellurite resistance protein